jgi:flagellar hook-basal body complex protein FliE
MNPLSAIRQFVAPQIQQAGLSKAVPDAANRGAIPLRELQQLPAQNLAAPPPSAPLATGSFGNVLSQFVHEVNGKQVAAGDAVQGLIGGQNVSLHQAMIAMEEASVSFQLMVEVRNKLLDSYQELMRMQI